LGYTLNIAREAIERSYVVSTSADRVVPATVASRPAVLIKPVAPGFGFGHVIVAEPFGLTIVAGDLPIEELVKIAESLY